MHQRVLCYRIAQRSHIYLEIAAVRSKDAGDIKQEKSVDTMHVP